MGKNPGSKTGFPYINIGWFFDIEGATIVREDEVKVL